MLWGGHTGGLELRKRASGAMALHGRFPYGKPAVLSDGGRTGRPRKEIIAPRAFAYRVNRPEEDIHLLIGHSFDRPLASRSAGTLKLKDSDEALTFEAEIAPEMQAVSWVTDTLSAISAGLSVGLSPGFRIPPERVEPKAEEVTEEDPAEGMALIRTVYSALLYELSVVTRPAYPESQVEARSWDAATRPDPALARTLKRWRA